MSESVNGSAPIRYATIDDRIIDMDELGHEIVKADGDLALVAERVLGNAARESELLGAISANPASLASFAAKAKALTIIKSISLLSAFQINALEGAHTLDAKTAAQLFIKMADSMERLATSVSAPSQPAQDNTLQELFDRLPHRLVAPLKAAIAQGAHDNLVGGDADYVEENGQLYGGR